MLIVTTMELSKEQQIAFDKYVDGKNIFITGPGGSGKSELIRRIYNHATRNFKDIHVCALTGCAAVLLNCNAKTVHSFAGIGLGNGTIEHLVQKIKQNKFAKNMWRTTEILIVDEVSMMSLKLFDTLNYIGKAMRNNCSRPFGGIQVIFSGDFYQLPPVGNKEEIDTTRFCFESDDWNSVFHRDCQIQLKKIFRQQSDDVFASILNQIRDGKIKRKTNDLLLQYVGRKCDDTDLVITKLFPTKNKVETINNNKMSELVSEEREYVMKYTTNAEPAGKYEREKTHYSDSEVQFELEYMANNLICDKTIRIKVGAQVMCIINLQSEQGVDICNGSQGTVTGFCEITGCPKVKYNNGREMVMARHTWTSEKIPGVGIMQVPLILAWALTIHKSQGATLDAAEIDVGSGIFECGQTYVALSRVKSLNGLYLTSFDVTKIKINKKVKAFYEALNMYNNESESENLVPLLIVEP